MQHSNTDSCILLKFYIKPQPETTIKTIGESCILLKFYIKPQQGLPWIFFRSRCILLKFYIKPQLCEFGTLHGRVVSYWNSTSNHNFALNVSSPTVLYLIEILHQTTTSLSPPSAFVSCILSKFYIKPQLYFLHFLITFGCILSKFYIKPQLSCFSSYGGCGCILSKFYIKPQHFSPSTGVVYSCILSKFYIKPQPWIRLA